MKIAVAGSGGLRTLATMQGAPTAGIAVDATNAYTSAGDAVMVTPLTGVGGATPFVQGTHSLAIAVDSNNVYFTDPSNGTIVAVPK
jgi:hypothetical protein